MWILDDTQHVTERIENRGDSDALADVLNGVAPHNRVMLLIAKCSGDPASAVTELWAAACRKSGGRRRSRAARGLSAVVVAGTHWSVTVQRHNTDRLSFGNTYGCADLEWSAVNLAEQIIAATSHLAHADEENFIAQFVG